MVLGLTITKKEVEESFKRHEMAMRAIGKVEMELSRAESRGSVEFKALTERVDAVERVIRALIDYMGVKVQHNEITITKKGDK